MFDSRKIKYVSIINRKQLDFAELRYMFSYLKAYNVTYKIEGLGSNTSLCLHDSIYKGYSKIFSSAIQRWLRKNLENDRKDGSSGYIITIGWLYFSGKEEKVIFERLMMNPINGGSFLVLEKILREIKVKVENIYISYFKKLFVWLGKWDGGKIITKKI